MACQCKNPDGTLKSMCVGDCVKGSIIQQEESARRDPMNGFAELIMSQVDQRIQNRMTTMHVQLQKEQLEIYKQAFIEGLKEGIGIGKGILQDHY